MFELTCPNQVASFTVLVFDWLVTLDLEVSLVWNSRWTITKIVYLINRYLPVLDFSLPYYFRSSRNQTDACMLTLKASIPLYIAEYTLAIRTCAVWGNQRIIAATLLLVLTGTFVFNAYDLFHNFISSDMRFFNIETPQISCFTPPIPGQKLYINYIVLAVYDAAMLGLMLYPTLKEVWFWSKVETFIYSKLVPSVYVEGTMFYAYLLSDRYSNLKYCQSPQLSLSSECQTMSIFL
ncbi:hypothetical protein NP233_g9714 [Leucocoprinus birnbaumii]|uniref:DUF6533 domain-containing protein n=1 Tax=Leucocoprinus birnbaumii TaxID=56174 RepID=A0AAD5YSK8_9AGAR|nr:hypothetical protein NP233_g9714 [Leucocoprinus birnbaumii]